MMISGSRIFCAAQSQGQQHRVMTVSADSEGRAHVVERSGREWIVPNETGQVSFDTPLIAVDGRTAGWLAEFPNCCTSYPIPLTLVLWRDGHVLRRVGNGMDIGRWQFRNGGAQVAYFTDTVHGNLAPACVLMDVATGREVGRWIRGKKRPLPDWAEAFREDIWPFGEPR